MAWAYVLWATAGGKNFSLSVIWNCGVTHLGGADASAPPFPFILHTLHVPPLSFGVRLLTSNRSVMRSTTTTMTPKKIFLTPFKLKMTSNGSIVTLRPQKSSHVG